MLFPSCLALALLHITHFLKTNIHPPYYINKPLTLTHFPQYLGPMPAHPQYILLVSWLHLAQIPPGMPLLSILTPPTTLRTGEPSIPRLLTTLTPWTLRLTKLMTAIMVGSSSSSCLRVMIDRLSRLLIDNGTIMEESMKMPCATLDVIGTTIKSKEHFWAHWDELLSDVRQLPLREYMHCPSAFVTSLPNAGSLMLKARRC